MDSGALKKPKKRNWGLIVALIVLVLIIIGLATGIIINHLNNKPEDNPPVDTDKDVVTEMVDYINSVDITEAEEYLDEMVEEYKGTEKELEVKMTKARYLRDIGKYEKALEIMDEILEENLDPKDTMKVFLEMKTTYEKMGDEEKTEEYNQKYWEEYLRQTNGGAGGA